MMKISRNFFFGEHDCFVSFLRWNSSIRGKTSPAALNIGKIESTLLLYEFFFSIKSKVLGTRTTKIHCVYLLQHKLFSFSKRMIHVRENMWAAGVREREGESGGMIVEHFFFLSTVCAILSYVVYFTMNEHRFSFTCTFFTFDDSNNTQRSSLSTDGKKNGECEWRGAHTQKKITRSIRNSNSHFIRAATSPAHSLGPHFFFYIYSWTIWNLFR